MMATLRVVAALAIALLLQSSLTTCIKFDSEVTGKFSMRDGYTFTRNRLKPGHQRYARFDTGSRSEQSFIKCYSFTTKSINYLKLSVSRVFLATACSNCDVSKI